MTLKSMFGKWLGGALLVSASVGVHAATYTITIDGVNPLAPPDTSAPGYVPTVLPGMFVGLGNCNPAPGFGNSCDGTVAVSTNPLNNTTAVDNNNTNEGTNFSYAAIYGYGLLVDQMIFHAFSQMVDVTNGVVTGGTGLKQTFDFVAGSTGGGSAGPFPGPFSYDLDFMRNVTITGGNLASPITVLVHQTATLTIGWDVDTLMINESDVVDFDLGADGILSLRLLSEGPILQGDPDIPVLLDARLPVSLPSSLSLVLLGFGALARRRSKPARN